MSVRAVLHVWILLLFGVSSAAQHLYVAHIDIDGLARTKEQTVLRELDFAVGDSIPLADLADRLERNRSNLLNTALFTEVEMNIQNWNTERNHISISVSVKEAWYLYLVPIIELADRNFNVWWKEHNAAFNRINLGIRAFHINVSGVRDRLKVKGQLGYTKKLETEYELPYFNKKRTLGGIVNILWSANKEVPYRVQGNKEVFFPESGIRDVISDAFRRFRIQAGLQFRPSLYLTHEFETSYHNNWIAPQIAEFYNPDFFLDGRSRQQFIGLRYSLKYDKRDLQLFPMKGWYASVKINKEGVGLFDDINSLTVSPYGEAHLPLSSAISLSLQGKMQYSLIREKQPFWNYVGLGFGRDYLRGYQVYVVNGQDFLYGKSSLKARFFQCDINWHRKMPRAFRHMPLQLYATMSYDIGHVYDPYYEEGNPLVNRTLYGWGPGISLVIYHTFAFSVEYNINDLGENGLFLHAKTSF